MTDRVKKLMEIGRNSKYTVGELAQAAGCTELTIRRHLGDGKLYSIKIGGRRYIPHETAVAYLTGQPCDRVPTIEDSRRGSSIKTS